MAGKFIISLDFELLWGVRDLLDRDSYGRNIIGAREAIPAILELFDRRGVHATWATVGFLLCESKDELVARRPDLLPSYGDRRLSNYEYFNEVGADERSDPHYFGLSLARQILSCSGQELATHTFSHYYALEEGQTCEQFRADIAAAVAIMRDRGVDCRSIVFPRNQFSQAHIDICRAAGMVAFRGTEDAWCYRSRPGADQSYARRLTRLTDSYVNLTGVNAPKIALAPIANIPASRFLRPSSQRLKWFEPLRLDRICRAMDAAAHDGGAYHLWWHPHNFGVNLKQNMAFLDEVLMHFTRLRNSLGMQSVNMAEAAARA